MDARYSRPNGDHLHPLIHSFCYRFLKRKQVKTLSRKFPKKTELQVTDLLHTLQKHLKRFTGTIETLKQSVEVKSEPTSKRVSMSADGYTLVENEAHCSTFINNLNHITRYHLPSIIFSALSRLCSHFKGNA